MIAPRCVSSSDPEPLATRTESQLPLSPMQSTNVWMHRATVLYNEITRIEAFTDGRDHG